MFLVWFASLFCGGRGYIFFDRGGLVGYFGLENIFEC